MPFYDPASGGFYSDDRADIPDGSVEITEERRAMLINSGRAIVMGPDGLPESAQAVAVTLQQILESVDRAADMARDAVVGDPLRAVEYDRARLEAEQFVADGYQGEVPRAVAAWAISGRTARQAADEILAEATAYIDALYAIREIRLHGKEQVRALSSDAPSSGAIDAAAVAVAEIERVAEAWAARQSQALAAA